ncbi:MAG: ADP-ribosylglycohydrolase family protein, partial [Lachnospiraceae bacterium]|nr:ADP-ribosylglycohydrolase family protein [Lachnospiraceae bacterium]
AEIIALWFGNMDFDETAHIIAMEGMDVDCTAAPVLNALAVMTGPDAVGARWIEPIGDEIRTTMRRMKRLKIAELCAKQVEAVRRARAGK